MINVQQVGLSFHAVADKLQEIKRDLTRFELRQQQGAEMQKHLNDFCAQVAKQERTTGEFENTLRQFWVILMADCQFVLDPNVALAARCDSSCLERNTILCLCAELRLHGCWLHGTLHKCGASYPSCKMIYTTIELQEMCLFSKTHLGYARIANSDSTYRNQRSTDGGAGHSNRKYTDSRREMNSLRDTFRIADPRDDIISAHVHELMGDSAVTEVEKSSEQIYAEMEFEIQKEKKKRKITPEPKKVEPVPAPAPALPTLPVTAKEPKLKTEDKHSIDKIAQYLKELEEKEERFNAGKKPIQAAPPPKALKARVSEKQKDKLRRIAEAKMHVVVNTILNDLLDKGARKYYNEYIAKAHTARLAAIIDSHLKNAQRDRVLPNLAHILTSIANAREEVEEISVELEWPKQAADRYSKIIISLWKTCFASPYVRDQLDASLSSPAADRRRKRNQARRAQRASRNGSPVRPGIVTTMTTTTTKSNNNTASEMGITHTPTSADLATLRQVALAVLYSLKKGLYLTVANSIFMSGQGGSVAGQDVCVFAPCEALALLMPPRSKTFYFGEVAQRALKARIARGYYGPAPFDPLEDLEHLDNVDEASASRSDAASMLLRRHSTRNSALKMRRDTSDFNSTRALISGKSDLRKASTESPRGVRSSSLVLSSRLGDELRSSQQAEIGRASRKRKKRSGTGHVALVDGERESGGSGYLSGLGNSSASAVSCVPMHMREPFLSGNSVNNKNLVYSERDMEDGFHFLRKSLESYGVKLHEVLNKI